MSNTNTNLSFLLEQKEAVEKKALAEKLKEEREFLLKLNYEKIPMEITFALLGAGASTDETKKVAEAWEEEQCELKDSHYLCGWSPYNATDEENAFLTPLLYRSLDRPSVAENMRSIKRIMKNWEYHFYEQNWKWREDYEKLSQDEQEASKKAYKETELKNLMSYFDETIADYPKEEAAHFEAYLKAEKERRNNKLSEMAWKLKNAAFAREGECLQTSVPIAVFEKLCKQISQKAMHAV